MKGKTSFVNRILALVIFLLVLGGYLGFYLFPVLSQGEAITPFRGPSQSVDASKSCNKFLNGLKATGIKYDLYTIYGSPLVLKDIEDPKETIYIAIDIERDYRDSEIKALWEFIKQGGFVILADDGTKGNKVNNVTDYFGGTPILKLNRDGSGGDLVQVNGTMYLDMINPPFRSQHYSLQMHRPVKIQRWNIQMDYPWTFMTAMTSDNVFLDTNGNSRFDSGESTKNSTVVDVQPTGIDYEGIIAFIGDPDIFTDKYIDLGGNATLGNNKQFLIDLVTHMMPRGGKILFDESRHTGTPFVGLGQGTFEAMVILTSNWNESALMVVGLGMVLVGMVARTKGKEDWEHRHNPNRRALREYLPETGRDARVLLRDALFQKIRTRNKLSEEELDQMPPDELKALVNDKELSRLLNDDCPDLSKEEVHRFMARIERWK